MAEVIEEAPLISTEVTLWEVERYLMPERWKKYKKGNRPRSYFTSYQFSISIIVILMEFWIGILINVGPKSVLKISKATGDLNET